MPDAPLREADVAIVGAGIAGASAAAHLAPHASVLLLEAEERPGYHSTGRSAALFSKTYGPAPIRALSRASEAFFDAPPEGFAAHPLLTPRGVIFAAGEGPGQAEAAAALAAELGEAVTRIPPDRAVALCPLLRREALTDAYWDDASRDIDVDALHQGFLRLARARGAELLTRAPLEAAAREGGAWRLTTPAGEIRARVLVNAAGAWADPVAERAGVRPAGVTPKRRTALIVDAPEGVDVAASRMAVGVAEDWYVKPEAGKVLISPADETPTPPCDAAPEEFDVALAVDRAERHTILQVRRIERRWAGLRSFARDKRPVMGFDPDAEGFFWLAGQGGYGIQTAPAAGRTAAALILGRGVPEDVLAQGLDPAEIDPARLRVPA